MQRCGSGALRVRVIARFDGARPRISCRGIASTPRGARRLMTESKRPAIGRPTGPPWLSRVATCAVRASRDCGSFPICRRAVTTHVPGSAARRSGKSSRVFAGCVSSSKCRGPSRTAAPAPLVPPRAGSLSRSVAWGVIMWSVAPAQSQSDVGRRGRAVAGYEPRLRDGAFEPK